MNRKVRELEIQGCRTFVCPNLSLIDEKGKDLNLKDDTIKRAKDLAVKYFKKTYHRPHYSSAKHLLPAFIYIASILEGERRYQNNIADVFGISHSTIRKWYNDIIDTLGIDIVRDRKRFKFIEEELTSPNLDDIDKEGKVLQLKEKTIERAKDLAIRYFETAPYHRYHPYMRQLFPAFIYTASLIENDRRTQLDIYKVSGISECVISKWHNDIIRTLGMKIISHDRRVISVLERRKDS